MAFSILEKSERFIQKRKKRRRWMIAFGCLGVTAAIGTGHALMRNGKAANYEYRELICTYEVHEHTAECYDGEGRLICGKADYVIHVHNEDCYDRNGELICRLPETEAHRHEESCFEEMPVLVCGEEGTAEGAELQPGEEQPEVTELQPGEEQPEVAGPQPGEEQPEVTELQPGEEQLEVAGPQPGEEQPEVTGSQSPETKPETVEMPPVQKQEKAAAAQPAEVQSGEASQETGTELTCTSMEHSHGDGCYGGKLTCTSGEHSHGDDCYSEEGELICTVEEHSHGDDCCSEELICMVEEHSHGDGCYSSVVIEEETGNGAGETRQQEVPEETAGGAKQEVAADAVESSESETPAGTTGEPEGHIHTEECFEIQMAAVCAQQEAHTHTETCYDGTGVLTCCLLELEEHVHNEDCFRILEPAAGSRTFYGDDYTITVSYGVDAGLPEEVEFSAEEIRPGTKAYQKYRDQAVETLKERDSGITSGRIFDLKFMLDDEEIEPTAAVDVEISYRNEEPKILLENPKVVHFAGEEEIPEVIDAEVQDGTYMFSADSFSLIWVGGEKVDPDQIKVRIVNNIEGTVEGLDAGCLYAELYVPGDSETGSEEKVIAAELLQQAEYAVKFTWYKKDIDKGTENFEEVERRENKGLGQFNVADNGEWLNVALDGGARCQYKVSLAIKDMQGKQVNSETESDDNGAGRVEYFDELQNGGFETPDLAGAGTKKFNYSEEQYKNTLYWKTTADNKMIEFAEIKKNGGLIVQYGWDAVERNPNGTVKEDSEGNPIELRQTDASRDRKGKQFAEINGDKEAALYQTVLTTPGTTLNWAFSHRARGDERATNPGGYTDGSAASYQKGTPEYDEMYLVIMPEADASEYDENHNNLKQFLGITGKYDTNHSTDDLGEEEKQIIQTEVHSENSEYTGDGKTVKGVQIVRIMSDDQSWHQCMGTYTVPEGQYLTRFFFVAGRTFYANGENHYDKHTEPGSKGNFIDEIWFSTSMPEPPAVPEGSARLTIRKHVYGISDVELADLKKSLQFTLRKTGEDSTETMQASNMEWYYDKDHWLGIGYVDVNFAKFDESTQYEYAAIAESGFDLLQTKYGLSCSSAVRAGTTTRTGSAEAADESGDGISWNWPAQEAESTAGTFAEGTEVSEANGGVTLKYEGTGENLTVTDAVVEFKNTYSNTKGLQIKKVSADNKELRGAEFEISVGGNKENGTTNEAGCFTPENADGLQLGKRYTLTETKAPDGYMLLKENIYFEVSYEMGESGEVNGYQVSFYNKASGGEKVNSEYIRVSGDLTTNPENPIVIEVVNEPQVRLPETGGVGTAYYLAIGIALIVAGLLYGGMRRKGERRRG